MSDSPVLLQKKVGKTKLGISTRSPKNELWGEDSLMVTMVMLMLTMISIDPR